MGIVTMARLAILALVFLTIHFTCGGHVQDNNKKPKKCALDYKKKYSKYTKKFQCINLEPPTQVQNALETCWKEAIDVDFVCQKRHHHHRHHHHHYHKGQKSE